MSRRTITEEEIALIKAMLNRGLKNKDIQFFFNRPDRPVNSGRISTIGSGTYSNSGEISAAPDAVLNAFVAKFESSKEQSSIGRDGEAGTPTITQRARSLFKRKIDGSWILEGGEHEECECKQDFDPKKIALVVRAIAALANNKGGFIFFGVSNDGCSVKGIGDSFSQTDIVQIVEKAKAHLSPTPSIAIKNTIDFEGLRSWVSARH